MRSTFKTVFYVNGSKEKNGIVPIMGRVTINGISGNHNKHFRTRTSRRSLQNGRRLEKVRG